MDPRTTFRLVETAVGGSNRRNHITPLSCFRPSYLAADVFATWPLYDEGLLRWHASHGGSVAGYRGLCWARRLVFDLDHKTDITVALAELRRLLYWLRDRWDIPLEALVITFSGSKGFHVEAPLTLFGGVAPAIDLPYRLGDLARLLLDGLDLRCIDPTAWEPLRLWRWENTKHGKTGRHAIPLTALEALTLTAPAIVALAATPRVLSRPDDADWRERTELVRLWLLALTRPATSQRCPSTEEGLVPRRAEGRPAQLAPIVAGCAWLRHTRDDAATLPEPDWYAMLSVVGRCAQGADVAHAWSAPHPDYRAEDTSAKLTRALTQTGPATCAHIANTLGFADCRRCPYRGRITSPIQLGRLAAPFAPNHRRTPL